MLSLALLTLAIGPEGAPDLEAQVKEIFEESCTACHDSSSDDVVLEGSLDHLRADSSAGIPLVKPGDPDGSYLYQKMMGADGIKGDAMPMGEDPLAQEQLEVVRDWITSLETAAEPKPAKEPVGGDVDHESMVRAIFEDSCTGCHDEGSDTVALAGSLDHLRGASSAGVSYVVPGDPDGSYLYQKLVGAEGIKGSSMPMGEDPLPEELLQEVHDWISAMPEGSWTQPGVEDEPLPVPKRKQRPGFAGTHQVALHTTTTLGKRAVEFRIHHRFGEIKRPFYDRTFFGLAGGAKMSIGAAYGIIDGLDVMVRWTNSRVGHELGVKYVPIRQEDGMPVSFGVYGSFEQFWDKPLKGCIGRSHCTVGSAQAMLSRFWFDRWATQLTLGYSALTNHSPDYQDEVDGELHDLHDERGTIDVGLASTVWLDKKKKWGVDVEYFMPLPIEDVSYYNGWSPEPKADGDPVRQIGGWSLGMSARAGLHLFQVFATNVQNIHTNLVAPGGNTTVPFSKDGANFFVGFNISRKWKL
jgi:hypothetical protein